MADSYVVTGAMMMCTFGMAPSSLVVLPVRTKMLSNVPRGNIMDFAPMVNIMPFGMCTTPSNPTVAAATAAAMGALTPMPCIPAVTTPWMPGNPMVLVQGQPALTRTCCNMCMWGGQITFTTDGQMPGIPPMFVPPVSVMMPEPLTDIEKSLLMPDEQWAYNNEWEQAKYAGAGDRAVADKLDEIASHYEQAGEFDKATQARETAGQFRERADKKQAAAMEAVNNKYRVAGGQTEQVVEKPMTTEELQGIHDQATKEQAQYEQEISQIDKQLAQNQEVINKQGEELATVSRELSKANESLKAANQEKEDATEKRETAEHAAKDAEWREESAKRRGDKEAAQYFHNQKKEAEKTAKEAAKEEEKATKKVAKAEKEYESVSKEQNKAYETRIQQLEDLLDENAKFENFMDGHRPNLVARNCGFGGLSISADGNVYFCNRVLEIVPQGNVKELGLRCFLEKGEQAHYETGVEHVTPCSTCAIRYICGGGCRIDEYDFKGKTWEKGQTLHQLKCRGMNEHMLDMMVESYEHKYSF